MLTLKLIQTGDLLDPRFGFAKENLLFCKFLFASINYEGIYANVAFSVPLGYPFLI